MVKLKLLVMNLFNVLFLHAGYPPISNMSMHMSSVALDEPILSLDVGNEYEELE